MKERIVYLNWKVYGPYKRSDKRLHVILVSKTGVKKTVSYPKFLVEKSIGRFLKKDETVHHINHDVNDNSLKNLKILKRSDHLKHHSIKYPKFSYFKCLWCKKEIKLLRHQISKLMMPSRIKKGPFCSKRCVGKYGRMIQLSAKCEFESHSEQY